MKVDSAAAVEKQTKSDSREELKNNSLVTSLVISLKLYMEARQDP